MTTPPMNHTEPSIVPQSPSRDHAEHSTAPDRSLERSKRPVPASMPADLPDLPPAMSLGALLTLLLGAIIGALAAVIVLPTWLPSLSASLLGSEPQAYWYLSRSSAVVAYTLLWLSMVFGLLMTSRLARLWPGGPGAFDLHQHTSLLGLAFAIFHALILLGDRYISATIDQILIPFFYIGYEPFWVGLGQLSLYGMAVIGFSFYVKQWIGRTLWRLIHTLSFVIWLLSLLHAIVSGSDTELLNGFYWFTGGSVLFLTIYRLLVTWEARRVKAQLRNKSQPSV